MQCVGCFDDSAMSFVLLPTIVLVHATIVRFECLVLDNGKGNQAHGTNKSPHTE